MTPTEKDAMALAGKKKLAPAVRLRNIYNSMRNRCLNPKSDRYHRYGGRGITICARWLESFENFKEDMGYPEDGHSIDRIDNDGNYEPGNCRWADAKTQRANQSLGGFAKEFSKKTHCPQGHPLSGDNLFVTYRGARECVICRAEHRRRYKQKSLIQRREIKTVCAEAYQAVGVMLSDLGLFDSEHGQKLLDNLSAGRLVHKGLLPWPSAQPTRAEAELAAAKERIARILQTNAARRGMGPWPDAARGGE